MKTEQELLERVTVNPRIFGGKPIVRGRRLAVEHVLGMWPPGILLTRFCRAIPGSSAMIFLHASPMPIGWLNMKGWSR